MNQRSEVGMFSIDPEHYTPSITTTVTTGSTSSITENKISTGHCIIRITFQAF
jgi:hypothetical protein